MGYLQKEGLWPNPDTPKTILCRNSTYKLHTKTAELPKLRNYKVRAPTGRKPKKYHVLFLNNEETMPFPHYVVVNSCNIDEFKWMCKLLMICEWMECN